jgi:hypothetical protein
VSDYKSSKSGLKHSSTVGEGDESDAAHVHILRRRPSTDDAANSGDEYGYFIQLPSNTSIAVNGATYIHEDDENTAPSPFFIGPLNRYTIIELLSQSIFFFRGRADLDQTTVLSDTKKNKPF